MAERACTSRAAAHARPPFSLTAGQHEVLAPRRRLPLDDPGGTVLSVRHANPRSQTTLPIEERITAGTPTAPPARLHRRPRPRHPGRHSGAPSCVTVVADASTALGGQAEGHRDVGLSSIPGARILDVTHVVNQWRREHWGRRCPGSGTHSPNRGQPGLPSQGDSTRRAPEDRARCLGRQPLDRDHYQPGIKKFVRTARRYAPITIRAGPHDPRRQPVPDQRRQP